MELSLAVFDVYVDYCERLVREKQERAAQRRTVENRGSLGGDQMQGARGDSNPAPKLSPELN